VSLSTLRVCHKTVAECGRHHGWRDIEACQLAQQERRHRRRLFELRVERALLRQRTRALRRLPLPAHARCECIPSDPSLKNATLAQ
jgi:hypothetical protein